MKAIIQRVMSAKVEVDGETISSIGRGLCVLIGISKNDSAKDLEYIARKIINIRLFENTDGKKWDKSVKDVGLEILCVSQFTLYQVLKGNKLDFHNAMSGEQSKIFYSDFISKLKNDYHKDRIKDGKFGAYMQVHIQNDGPVTVTLESESQTKENAI